MFHSFAGMATASALLALAFGVHGLAIGLAVAAAVLWLISLYIDTRT